MTAPRQVLRGTTYLVTRRCTQRQFLLKPSRITTGVFRYVLAHAARRCGVAVHAACVLSNHYHLVVTDPDARLPEFQQLLDALVARAVNAQHGRWETFWGPSSYSAVALASPRDILDKVAYTLANPVAAGLVRAGRQWPGVWSAPEEIGAEQVRVDRPRHFFARTGSLPESIEFTFEVPPGFASAAEFRNQLAEALAAREAEAVRKRAGLGFLGVLKVLAQQPSGRPREGAPRRQLRPRVAARDQWRRRELLDRLVTFLAEYRGALRAWRAGAEVVFPEGTYLMRVAHGAECAGAG